MSGERLDRLEAHLAEHLELLGRVRAYLETDAARERVLELELADLRDRAGNLERRVRMLEAGRVRPPATRRAIAAAHRRHELALIASLAPPPEPNP